MKLYYFGVNGRWEAKMRELNGGVALLRETPRQVVDASLIWLCSHIADTQFPDKSAEEREVIAMEILEKTIESTWEMLKKSSKAH